MAEEHKKKDEFDIFIANSIYPQASSIFSFRLASLQDIKDECCIVLDTNVLLKPYTTYEGNLLEQCRNIYTRLIKANRLFIPGQVAREFAANRTSKLSELHQKFSKKQQIPLVRDGNYPLLSNVGEYKRVTLLEEEIDKKLQEYKKAVKEILTYIEQWTWNDPVSLLYNELFTEEVVVDPTINKEELQKDLEKRQLHKIPPGYKDAGKEDRGIGDLLIWHTVLETGRTRKRSVIFVSNDGKPDWFKQSEKAALYLRYELVDEFRRITGGHSFHVIRFSDFLELYEANEAVVEEIKQEEQLLKIREDIHLETPQGIYALPEKFSQLLKEFVFIWKVVYRSRSESQIEADLSSLKNRIAEIGNNLLLIDRLRGGTVVSADVVDRVVNIGVKMINLSQTQFYLEGGQSIRAFNELGENITSEIESIIGKSQNFTRYP